MEYLEGRQYLLEEDLYLKMTSHYTKDKLNSRIQGTLLEDDLHQQMISVQPATKIELQQSPPSKDSLKQKKMDI